MVYSTSTAINNWPKSVSIGYSMYLSKNGFINLAYLTYYMNLLNNTQYNIQELFVKRTH